MPVFISLLRGVNVSGQKKIIMRELKQMYESLGFKDVITYIQSGNVIFKTAVKTAEILNRNVADKIKETFGFEVFVRHILLCELQQIIKENPFHKNTPEQLYVGFLERNPDKENEEKLQAAFKGADEWTIKNQVIYLHYKEQYSNSKLNNNFIENKLKLKATTRNWKTILKLEELAASL